MTEACGVLSSTVWDDSVEQIVAFATRIANGTKSGESKSDQDKREDMIFYHGHDAFIRGVKSLWVEFIWMSYLTEPTLESMYLSLHMTLSIILHLVHNSLVSRQESMVLARASGRLRMMMWRYLLCHLRWRKEVS